MQFIRSIYKYARTSLFIVRHLRLFRFSINDSKTVYFDLDHNPFTRHIYGLIKYLRIQGFKVYINPKIGFLHDCLRDRYTREMFENSEVFISFKSPNFSYIFSLQGGTNLKLDPNYYSKKNQNADDKYYIPFFMHPLIYSKNLFSQKTISTRERYNSVFFAGNIGNEYDITSNKKYFDVDNRVALISSISTVYKIMPKNRFQYYNAEKNNKLIIIDTNHFRLKQERYLSELSKYDFFLACPGIVKPTSHNLIEAIFCQTIPIIQRAYAQLMKPPLEDGKHAIIFNSLEDLNLVIESAFTLNKNKLDQMQQHLNMYYKNYLSSEAVVSNLINKKFSTYFLEAEYESLRLLQLERRRTK